MKNDASKGEEVRLEQASKPASRIERSLFSWRSWAVVLFAFAAAITITVTFLLSGIDLPLDVIRERSPIVVANVLFISALATLVWGLWRRRTTQRPVERILAFTERVAQGDFGARVEIERGPLRNEFDVIAEDLNRMAAELGSVEALREDFVASVSHEMKTPLSAMSNYATIMQDPTLSEADRLEYARKTGQAARRLSDMVGNMLRLNKLDNCEITPEPMAFDLSEQLAECLLAWTDAIDEAGLELEADLAEGICVEGDPELSMLAWNNLVGNAVKFTDAGGLISVRLTREGAFALVTVADTGCGMSEESVRHVFEKFWQADTSRAQEGNGLGLALVKRIAQMYGGDVAAESELGAGSAFSVRLPIAKG